MTSAGGGKVGAWWVTQGIVEVDVEGVVVLKPAARRPIRKILHVNAYGGRFVWEKVKAGLLPAHQLLGCVELARMGYEVALAEPVSHFNYRRPFPHDLGLFRFARSWLGADDIIFSGHTLLWWIPLLRRLKLLGCPIVSLTYAREDLDFAAAHSGILSLTPAGADQARKLAPRVKSACLGWGVDLQFFQKLPYQPEYFFSCGIANRDFQVMCDAAQLSASRFRIICPGFRDRHPWPPNVDVIDGGAGWVTDRSKVITVKEIISDYYPRSSATMVVIKPDPAENTANGFTNLIEAMAVGQPVIVTKTGALPGELDVENAGIGLHVQPASADSLAAAVARIAAEPDAAVAMGDKGRLLCEKYYNLGRYSRDLHAFFESL